MNNTTLVAPCLVAHRGQSATMPENSLAAIQAAINCGAKAVEFDVQMSSDLIPLVCHDISLARTTGMDIDIATNRCSEIQRYMLTGITPPTPVPSLQDMVNMLEANPDVTAFVELKKESFEFFGIQAFLTKVLQILMPVQKQCVIIADRLDALQALQSQAEFPIGWIVHRWHKEDLSLATQLSPNFMIINHHYCEKAEHDFSADPWQWMMYETSKADKAKALFEAGIQFVETNDICLLLRELD